MWNFLEFTILMVTIYVLVFILGPIVIFKIFPSVSIAVKGFDYILFALVVIALIPGVNIIDTENLFVRMLLVVVALSMAAPIIFLKIFPSANRLILISSYIIFMVLVQVLLIQRYNRKMIEKTAAEEKKEKQAYDEFVERLNGPSDINVSQMCENYKSRLGPSDYRRLCHLRDGIVNFPASWEDLA